MEVRRKREYLRSLLLLQVALSRVSRETTLKNLLILRLLCKRRHLFRQMSANYNRLLVLLLKNLRKSGSHSRKSSGVRMWVRPRSSAWWDDVVPLMDPHTWKEHFRVSKKTFDLLCQKLSTYFRKKDTNMRRSIPLRKRVAMCLYMLSTSSDFGSASEKFGVGKSTLWEALHHFCACIGEHLAQEVIIFPAGETLQAAIAGFSEDLGFPQCFGAVTTSHIPIPFPKHRAFEYLNPDEWHSIVMLAACDHAHRFIYLDVEHLGSESDPEIFGSSHLLQLLEFDEFGAFNRTIGDSSVPLSLLGPPTFPLLPNVMTPYSDNGHLDGRQQAFNSSHSRAFGIIEETIRRVATRFPIVVKKPEVKTENFPGVVHTCCVLHNMCEIVGDSFDWELNVQYQGIRLHNSKNAKSRDETANSIRDALAVHFQNDL